MSSLRLNFISAALAAALAVPAHGQGMAMGKHVQRCLAKAKDTCSEWDVMSAGPQLQPRLEAACKSSGGTVAMSPCPTKKRVGSCKYPPGVGVVGSQLSFYPPKTEKEARQVCAGEKGVFAAK